MIMYPNREMLVQPIKGSAAFWINMEANGKLEPDLLKMPSFDGQQVHIEQVDLPF